MLGREPMGSKEGQTQITGVSVLTNLSQKSRVKGKGEIIVWEQAEYLFLDWGVEYFVNREEGSNEEGENEDGRQKRVANGARAWTNREGIIESKERVPFSISCTI